MISLKKMSAFTLALLFTVASATVYAQVDQRMGQPTQSPTMNQPPSTPMQSPQMDPPQQQNPFDQNQNNAAQQQLPDINQSQDMSATEISDEELKEFAAVYPKVQTESQKAQQEMVAIIEKDGMKLERFNEIQTAKLQNQKTDASKEEMKQFKQITDELDAMQPQIQANIESIITSSGLSVQRFQTIAAAIQSDPSLMSRFQELLNGKA